jgi:hypothetical protein
MPQHATNAKLFQSAQSVGKSMKLEVVEASVRSSAKIEAAIGALAAEPDSGVLVLPSPVTTDGPAAGPIRNQRMLDWGPDLVVAFAGVRGLPTWCGARAGGVEVIEP